MIPFNRKIFYCVEETFKKEEIHVLDELNKLMKIELEVPEFWEDADTLRFVYEFGWENSVVYEKLKDHFFWLKNLETKRMSYEAKSLIDCGIVYQSGRDKQYRPNVFINLSRVENLKGKQNFP